MKWKPECLHSRGDVQSTSAKKHSSSLTACYHVRKVNCWHCWEKDWSSAIKVYVWILCNNSPICKAPKALASEALAAGQSWVWLKSLREKYVLSLDLKTASDSALIIVSGNKFQAVGAEQRKARLAKSVLVNGLSSSGTPDERSVRSLTRALMWRLRCVGAMTLLRLLNVNTATWYSILCWMFN